MSFLRRAYMNNDGFNTATTSQTFYQPRQVGYVWNQIPKHCGGMTECGLACHKGMNCTIVDEYQKDGKTVLKYYCRTCKEFGEGAPNEGCKD